MPEKVQHSQYLDQFRGDLVVSCSAQCNFLKPHSQPQRCHFLGRWNWRPHATPTDEEEILSPLFENRLPSFKRRLGIVAPHDSDGFGKARYPPGLFSCAILRLCSHALRRSLNQDFMSISSIERVSSARRPVCPTAHAEYTFGLATQIGPSGHRPR